MATSSFLRADALGINTRTQVYPATGVVGAGVTAIVFSGTASNVDATNKATHTVTFEILRSDGTTYVNYFPVIPLPYGGVSDVPKVVLGAGEKLVATADTASVINVSLSVVERS